MRGRAAAVALALAAIGFAGPVGAQQAPAQEQPLSPQTLRAFADVVVKRVSHPGRILVYVEVGRVEGGNSSSSSFKIFYVSPGEQRVRIDANSAPQLMSAFMPVIRGVQAGGKAPLAMSILIDQGEPSVLSPGPFNAEPDGFTARAAAAAASAFPGFTIDSLPTQ